MKKNPQQTELTKQKLQTAFWDIYEEKTFEKITVREITERAGVNRSTFYAYYKDVYDVLEQVENEILSTFNVSNRFNANFLDREQYQSELYFFGEFLRKNQKAIMLLIGEKGDPKFSSKLWTCARENIYENLQALSGNKDTPFLEYIVEYIINCHAGILIQWCKNNCDIPFEQIADFTYRLMVGGVTPFITNSVNPYDQIADYILQRIKENL